MGVVQEVRPYQVDVENISNNSQDAVVVNPVRSWKGLVWDTWELPHDQRWFLFKLDAFILTFASIGYFLKNLDQQNVKNAFLSGMKEDLHMYSDQLVTSRLLFIYIYILYIPTLIDL